MYILEYAVVFLIALVLIYLVKANASLLSLIDVPNNRSEHIKLTPRGAGIGFILSFILSISIFHFDICKDYSYTFLAILMVFAVGILDDRHDTAPKTKFIVIMIATFMLYMDHIAIYNMGTYFGFDANLGWFALPFTMFAMAGFTNALNLIDGLDGLAASLSLVIFVIFAILGYNHQDDFIFYISSYFIVSLIAFLLFNWNPASIFMGDSGSLTLGFVIAMLGIKSLEYLPAVSMLFITGIPIMDTLIVMIRRKRAGKSAFSPDKCHIHHILKTFFQDNIKRTVMFLIFLQSIYAIIGIIFAKVKDDGFMMIFFILNIVLLYLLLQAMIKRQNRKC